MIILVTIFGSYRKMKFKAAILTEIKKPLEITDLEVPELKSGQLLVKMFYSSICGTQINEINGLKGKDKYLPHTLGHEGYGEVVDIAKGISKVRVGDRVIVTWIKGRGLECENIKYGNINSGKACTLSEYSIVSENRIVPISIPIELEKYAPLLGCCIPTGAGTVEHELSSSSKVLVLGLGGVGTAACIWASLKCSDVYGYDILESRKNILSIINIAGYNNNIVDHVIDTTGNIDGFRFGWECLTRKGKLVVVGNPPKDIKFSYAQKLNIFKDISGKEYRLQNINSAISNWGKERKPIIKM